MDILTSPTEHTMESTAPTTPLTIAPSSLAAAFSSVPDPRRQASVLYPLPAVLALAVAAVLCACTSVLAIAEWGADQEGDLLRALGFPEGTTPCQTTLHRLFRRLDGRALATALRTAFAAPVARARGAEGVAIDGKAQRGRLQFEEGGGAIHVLTAFAQERSVILTEEPIERGADKGEAELSGAPRVIEQLDWQGRVLTGDALHCQASLCRQVCERGGDYLLTVKANQRTLYRALRRAFDPQGRPPLDRREVRTIDKGHGRVDVRHLIATADPLALPDWPGVAQMFRVERHWRERGKDHRQVRYGITSLPPSVGSPRRLLALKRGHWLIENRGHRAKDVNLGEDASLIHTGQGPTVCTILRAAALSLLQRAGFHAVASRLRHHSRHPEKAVALVFAPDPARA
jgi:predicted transposase YbfD/YdcC